MQLRKNYLNGEPHKVGSNIIDSDIFRYYICDEKGNKISPDYEISTDSFHENIESMGMNLAHRPYFPAFISARNVANKIFTVSEVYRDVKSRKLCRTYALNLGENKVLLVDALVEDEIIYAK